MAPYVKIKSVQVDFKSACSKVSFSILNSTSSRLRLVPVSTGIGPQSLPERRLGQDLGFGGFAFALKFPELLNTNLAAVRAKLGQTSCFPNGPHYFIGNPNLLPYWCPIGQ